jgi:hypothetical protein
MNYDRLKVFLIGITIIYICGSVFGKHITVILPTKEFTVFGVKITQVTFFSNSNMDSYGLETLKKY